MATLVPRFLLARVAAFGWTPPARCINVGGQAVHELALLGQAGQALAEARSFDEIKEIRDKAEAVRKYAQSASLGLDIQNRAAEVKLRAERQAGKLLSEMTLRGGDRRSKSHNERLKLDDLGISRNQSTRWQMQARVPESVFREHIKLTCDAGKELTSARLIRLAKQWSESRRANGHARAHGRDRACGASGRDRARAHARGRARRSAPRRERRRPPTAAVDPASCRSAASAPLRPTGTAE